MVLGRPGPPPPSLPPGTRCPVKTQPLPFRAAIAAAGSAVRQTTARDVTGGRRGVALLVVMTLVTILIAVSSDFAYGQMTNVWMKGNISASTKAHFAARGALKIAVLAVNAKRNYPEIKQALALIGQSSKGAARIEIWRQACEFTKVFCTGRASFFGMDFMDFSEEKAVGLSTGECTCEVDSEDARVNLNAAATDTAAALVNKAAGAPAPTGRSPRSNPARAQGGEQARNQLGLRLYGLYRPMLDSGEFDSEEEIIALILNIMDWTDNDDTKTDVGPDGRFVDAGGAESSDYGQYGYQAKNAKMDTVGEVQLVDGMRSDIYCRTRDNYTVFSTDKININDASPLILRGILCEAIQDEALRVQYCYNPLAAAQLQLQPIDGLLVALEQCRRLKKAIYSTPFTTFGRFNNFLRQYPQATQQPQIPFNQSVLSQQLGVQAKMVRVTATGKYCRNAACEGFCIARGTAGGGGDDDDDSGGVDAENARLDPKSGRRLCKDDSECGSGTCAINTFEKKMTAVIDTSTGSLVHFKTD